MTERITDEEITGLFAPRGGLGDMDQKELSDTCCNALADLRDARARVRELETQLRIARKGHMADMDTLDALRDAVRVYQYADENDDISFSEAYHLKEQLFNFVYTKGDNKDVPE